MRPKHIEIRQLLKVENLQLPHNADYVVVGVIGYFIK